MLATDPRQSPSSSVPTQDMEGMESGREITLQEIVQAVHHRLWWVVALVGAVTVITSIWMFKSPSLYSAMAVVQVNRQAPRVAKVEDINDPGQQTSQSIEFLQTQLRVLKSRNLAERVIRRLNLETDPLFNPPAKEPSLWAQIRTGLSTFLPKPPEMEGEPGADLPADRPLAGQPDPKLSRLVKRYYRALDVKLVRNTLLFEVLVSHPARSLVSRLANAHAEEYMAYTLEQRFGLTGKALDLLQNEAKGLQEQLQLHEEALQAYRVQQGITTDLEKEEEIARAIKQDLAMKEAEQAKLSERYLEKHPKIIEARSAIEQLKADLRAKDVLVLQMREKNIGYDRLKRQVDSTRQMYEAILTRIKEMDVTNNMDTTNITILDRAVAPRDPTGPQRLRNIGLALAGSLVLSVLACIAIELLTQTFRSPEEIRMYLGVPFLGYVPHAKSSRPGAALEAQVVAGGKANNSLAEAFRTIQMVLQHQPESNQAKVFLVTSAAPGEGKSFCAMRLALSLVESGHRTLVVDADLRRPNLAKSLEMSLESGPGTDSLIEDGVDFRKMIRPTDIKNLSVVLTRTAADHAPMILGGNAFRRFLLEMRQQFDRVIVDSAPVGAVGDSIALAALVDGVIWVTRFNKIRRRVVLDAFSRLVQTRAKVFGAILNDLDLSKKANYYYYSYKYYSKYYHRSAEDG